MAEFHSAKTRKNIEEESVNGPLNNIQPVRSTEESKWCTKTNAAKGGHFLFMEQGQPMQRHNRILQQPKYATNKGNNPITGQGPQAQCQGAGLESLSDEGVANSDGFVKVDTKMNYPNNNSQESSNKGFVPGMNESPQLEGAVSPTRFQSTSAHTTSDSRNRCLSLNLVGATRGPLRRLTSFSLGSRSATNDINKRTPSPAKEHSQTSNKLSDDYIRNRNRIILKKHDNVEPSPILESEKKLGIKLNEPGGITI
ncbi:hypothetical protein VNO78_21953 [Psophocarpus tetragonolobus]|uniref:Uncharacterized protein n=1 Tax=Psophocarpus tetragonolobus TaxID=3891 RepID=A0AAN9XII5_PSOTE